MQKKNNVSCEIKKYIWTLKKTIAPSPFKLNGCSLMLAGIIRFTQTVKAYEKQDPEIAQLNQELKEKLIPPVSMSALHGNEIPGS